MKFVISLFFFCLSPFLWAQSDLITVGELPVNVIETSGLITYNGKLITHNDSGNLPQLYEIDKTTLEITRVVTISNAVNTDWEDITQDDLYIYIGDIGNNNGTRTDLKILKIRKSDYDVSDTVAAETISYNYEDQTDFTNDGNSDFDAEALIVLGDNLLIFTKQWQSLGTAAYSLPKLPGNYVADNIGEYQIDGLITGATYSPDDFNEFYLIGYSEFLFPFFVRINFQQNTTIFSGEIIKSPLNVGVAQVESIALDTTSNQFYFTSEEFINQPIISTRARLFSFFIEEEEEEEENGENEEGEEEENEELGEILTNSIGDVILFKVFGDDTITYSLPVELRLLALGIFDASGQLLELSLNEDLQNSEISLATLSSGIYYATFYFEGTRIVKAFQKD